LQSAGGEDSTLEAEKNLMASRGHEIELLLFDNADMGKGAFGKVSAGLRSIYNPKSARKIRAVINEFKPDVVHVHNFFFDASPSVMIEATKLNVPVVVTLHNFRLVCASALLLRDNKICELCVSHSFPWFGVKYKCYHNSAIQSAMVGGMAAVHKWIGTWKKNVDTFITPSAFGRKKLLGSSLKPSAEKIKVKHNFLEDPGIGDPDKRENFYLYVGRFSSEKGIEFLLEAWRSLPSEKLVAVGDGPQWKLLKEKYQAFSNISFRGKEPRNVVLDLIKKSKALIFPSICYEGLPLTVIEAFATGTPVLSSALGAMNGEMIKDVYNGILFAPGNPVSISEAVLKFNDYLHKADYTLYNNARTSYLESYHPDKCYNDIMEVYASAIKQRSKKNNG
jgi:glycosyltransferase involved in cell wall biosynthesis